MVCPSCHNTKTKVNNSRKHQDGFSVWRRRECLDCRNVMTTTEKISLESTIVINDSDSSLTPLRYLDIFVSIYNALGGTKDLIREAEALSDTCLTKILKLKKIRLRPREIQGVVFETLDSYNKLAGRRYKTNELGRID